MIYIFPTDTCFWLACAIDDIKSYHKIYDIKKRPLNKPLSIMVDSFLWLEKNTSLNKEQIEFLIKYNKPFTIITDCNNIKMLLNLEQDDFEYQNKEVYEKFAFRVANNEIQKKLIKEVWLIFLTSANFSWEKEIYSTNEIKKQFWNISWISILWNEISLDSSVIPSDILEFINNSLEYNRLR